MTEPVYNPVPIISIEASKSWVAVRSATINNVHPDPSEVFKGSSCRRWVLVRIIVIH
jgi:hypothetical protein